MPPVPPSATVPRIVVYYQTLHDPSGRSISILPLLTQPGIAVTHVILAALHINGEPSELTLNDHSPAHPRHETVWAELRVLQAAGIKVMCLLGGAAQGSYQRLDGSEAEFERFYVPLRDLIRQRSLDGVELDVEEEMSRGGVIRLIDRLRADFGEGFTISMAPVAMAMLDSTKNMSGFDYEALEVMRGRDIAWYNTQFYCGWGSCGDPIMYEMMITRGWPMEKIVIGLVTNPENGSGWVPWEMLGAVLLNLRGRYTGFGGVMGWEYFNSLPAGRERPWEWAKWMTTMLRPPSAARPNSAAPLAQPKPVETSKVAGQVQKELVEHVDLDGPNSKDAPLPEPFEYYSDGSDEN
jgi:hypothetical protein